MLLTVLLLKVSVSGKDDLQLKEWAKLERMEGGGNLADRQELVSKHLLNETEQWLPLGMGIGPIWWQSWVMRLHWAQKWVRQDGAASRTTEGLPWKRQNLLVEACLTHADPWFCGNFILRAAGTTFLRDSNYLMSLPPLAIDKLFLKK